MYTIVLYVICVPWGGLLLWARSSRIGCILTMPFETYFGTVTEANGGLEAWKKAVRAPDICLILAAGLSLAYTGVQRCVAGVWIE